MLDIYMGILLWFVGTGVTAFILGRYTDFREEAYVFGTLLWPFGLCFAAGHLGRNLEL